MSAPLPFLELDGIEVANGARTFEYIRNLQGYGRHFNFGPGCMCQALYREAGSEGMAFVFVSPSADPAPWYTASIPASGEFLGLLITDLDGWDTPITRSVTERVGGIGGATLGPEHLKGRAFQIRGFLIATSCPGLDYGRRWLSEHLGATNCDTCLTRTLKIRSCCPVPDDGTDDDECLWYAYDVGLTEALMETENDGLDRCCDAVEVTFTLTAENPYLYEAPVACVDSEELNPPLPVLAPVIEDADLVLDNFNRADSPNLGGGWSTAEPTTVGLGGSLHCRISSNQAATQGPPSASIICSDYWASPWVDGNMVVAATVAVKNGGAVGEGIQLWSRFRNPGGAVVGYRLVVIVSAGADDFILQRVSGGAVSIAATTREYAVGDRMAIVTNGTSIEGWVKPLGGTWTRLLQVVDAVVPAAGAAYAAITLSPSGGGSIPAIDDFSAGPWGCGGDVSFCSWLDASPDPVCCAFTEPDGFGITGAIVTIEAVTGDVSGVTINSYNPCPFAVDHFDGSGALINPPWQRGGANTIVQAAGVAVPGSGLAVTYRYIYGSRTYANTAVVAKFTTAGTGTAFTFGLSIHADSNVAIDTSLYGVIDATSASIRKRIAGVETTLNTVGFTPVVSTSYWLVFALAGAVLTLNVYESDPHISIGDTASDSVTPVATSTYTLTAAEVAAFPANYPGFRWAPTVDSGSMDDFKVYDNDAVAVSTLGLTTIPAGYTLIVDSSRHAIILVAPDGTETDGSNLIELVGDSTFQWIEASLCQSGSCVCVSLDHFCGADESALVTIETQVRAR